MIGRFTISPAQVDVKCAPFLVGVDMAVLRTVALAFTVLILFGAPAFSAAQESQKTTVHGQSNLVLVPVIVHTRDGQHVSGLQASDFVLTDNGKPEKVASIEEITADTRTAEPVSIANGVVIPEFANWTRPKNITVIAIDLVNTPIMDVARARTDVLKFLASHVGADQMIALVTIEPGQVRLLHSFTNSSAILQAALHKVTGITSPADLGAPTRQLQQSAVQAQALATQAEMIAKESQSMSALIAEARAEMNASVMTAAADFSSARRNQGIAATLESLQQIASWVGGIPGRKSIVWITGDVPFITSGGSISLGNVSSAMWTKTSQLLSNANVALYPVDVRGLLTDIQIPQPSTSLMMNSSAAGISARSQALQRVGEPLQDSHEAMDALADMTGGKAFYNTNDIPKVLDMAAADSAEYYVLSYYFDSTHAKHGWHKLGVKVDKPGLSVRARTGFDFSEHKEEKAAEKQATEMTALVSPFNFSALPFAVRLPMADPKKKDANAQFLVNLPGDVLFAGKDDPDSIDIDVLAAATDAGGKIAARFAKAIHQPLTPQAVAQIRQYGVTYMDALKLAPGDYTLRVVIRDNLSGRLGGLTAPLTVR